MIDLQNVVNILNRKKQKEAASHTGLQGNVITYNAEQQKFVDLLASGKSCVLMGAAGTGKTTCTQGAIQQLLLQGDIPVLEIDDHSYLESETPGIIITSYTRRAVNNIRKVIPEDLKRNCLTIHSLLEYVPVSYEVRDIETDLLKKTMRFEPLRNDAHPLPNTIHTVIIEEASMLSVDLYTKLAIAFKHEIQWVFIGDIQQLKPIFGASILGFKMIELPRVTLTHVYRQALESPIIKLAHRILSGKPISVFEFPKWNIENKLTITPWKKKVYPDTATALLARFFISKIEDESYDPDENVILIPFNKSCGTIELNKHIANYLSKRRGEVTYEIQSGFNKVYFSVGDKILYDKEEGIVDRIIVNNSYTGIPPQLPSEILDYWGNNTEPLSSDILDNPDISLDSMVPDVSVDERVNQASHKVLVRLFDSGRSVYVYKVSDMAKLIHCYALTIHKAQGSEWDKVFFVLHDSHSNMTQRELLYTAVTRASNELHIICEPTSFVKGITNQAIKGDTIEEKAEYFKGKQK